MANELVRKVTIAQVASKTRILKALMSNLFTDAQRADGKAEIAVCRIYGTAVRYRAGMGDNGEFIKFDGNFRAVDIMPDGANGAATGVIYDGGVSILPNFLNGPLMSAIDTTKQPVSFGVEVSAIYDASAATSYKFGVKNLMPAQPQADPLLQLETAMGLRDPSTLALTNSAPAPSPAPAPAASATRKR